MKILYILFVACLMVSTAHPMKNGGKVKIKELDFGGGPVIAYIQKSKGIGDPIKLYVQKRKTETGEDRFLGFIHDRPMHIGGTTELDNDEYTASLWNDLDKKYNKKDVKGLIVYFDKP